MLTNLLPFSITHATQHCFLEPDLLPDKTAWIFRMDVLNIINLSLIGEWPLGTVPADRSVIYPRQ